MMLGCKGLVSREDKKDKKDKKYGNPYPSYFVVRWSSLEYKPMWWGKGITESI